MTEADASAGPVAAEEFADRQIVIDYADQVAIATYRLLAERANALNMALFDLGDDPTTVTLEAAKRAWSETRVPLEEGTALLGPGMARDWETTRDGLQIVKAVLWDPESPSISNTCYMLATDLTRDIEIVAGELLIDWTEGTEGQPAYRELLATAGQASNSVYPSLGTVAIEILGGMRSACDEAANRTREPGLVGSGYGDKSVATIQFNMRSVLNAYTGDVLAAGTQGSGLDEWVAERDEALDQRLKAEINQAIAALGEIRPLWRDAITDPTKDDTIETAQRAISAVQSTIASISHLILVPD